MPQKPLRSSFYLNEDDQRALSAIKQHYGISSNAAVRRALQEHAKQITEPEKVVVPISYSRRVH